MSRSRKHTQAGLLASGLYTICLRSVSPEAESEIRFLIHVVDRQTALRGGGVGAAGYSRDKTLTKKVLSTRVKSNVTGKLQGLNDRTELRGPPL